MAGVATISIVGYVGADPDVRSSPEGRLLARFRVAVNRGKRNGAIWQEHTDWFSVSVFGPLVERFAGRLAKGSRVLVIGRLETHTWRAGDSEIRVALQVVATEVIPLDRPRTSDQADALVAEPEEAEADADDELPF